MSERTKDHVRSPCAYFLANQIYWEPIHGTSCQPLLKRETQLENSVPEAHNLDGSWKSILSVSNAIRLPPERGLAGPPRKSSLNLRINIRAKQKARHLHSEDSTLMAPTTGDSQPFQQKWICPAEDPAHSSSANHHKGLTTEKQPL